MSSCLVIQQISSVESLHGEKYRDNANCTLSRCSARAQVFLQTFWVSKSTSFIHSFWFMQVLRERWSTVCWTLGCALPHPRHFTVMQLWRDLDCSKVTSPCRIKELRWQFQLCTSLETALPLYFAGIVGVGRCMPNWRIEVDASLLWACHFPMMAGRFNSSTASMIDFLPSPSDIIRSLSLVRLVQCLWSLMILFNASASTWHHLTFGLVNHGLILAGCHVVIQLWKWPKSWGPIRTHCILAVPCHVPAMRLIFLDIDGVLVTRRPCVMEETLGSKVASVLRNHSSRSEVLDTPSQ